MGWSFRNGQGSARVPRGISRNRAESAQNFAEGLHPSLRISENPDGSLDASQKPLPISGFFFFWDHFQTFGTFKDS